VCYLSVRLSRPGVSGSSWLRMACGCVALIGVDDGRLSDLWIRPAFGGRGRKMSGTLEAHTNGFRYSTMRQEEKVDVMYRNIKHAFFQPAEKEMITLVHFHLHNYIMVGTKKMKDVQFFVEVGGGSGAGLWCGLVVEWEGVSCRRQFWLVPVGSVGMVGKEWIIPKLFVRLLGVSWS
jgi:hypothetical protein